MGRHSTTGNDEIENNGEVWIKSVPKGNTRVRILQPTITFPRWREHYEASVKAFKCDGSADCPGCTDADVEVQRRSRKFGFNCLTQDGRLTVYKCGPDLMRKLERKEDWHGKTLMDRDWILIRTGDRLETEYDAEAGEKYAVDMPKEIYNIDSIVGAQYWEARRAYGLSVDEDDLASCKVEVMVPGYEIFTEEAPPAEVEETVDVDTTKPQLWKTEQLKDYIVKNNLEAPEKAPRSRLVTIVDEHIASTEQPPF